MIVDTSALMAILLGEPEAQQFVEVMSAASSCSISAGNWIELTAVCVRRGYDLDAEIEVLLAATKAQIVPVSLEQARIGESAYRAFGIGSGHAARLNFGDCFAYALARESGEPLLYKGDDFAQTDVVSALEA